jgi:hypothetical protein
LFGLAAAAAGAIFTLPIRQSLQPTAGLDSRIWDITVARKYHCNNVGNCSSDSVEKAASSHQNTSAQSLQNNILPVVVRLRLLSSLVSIHHRCAMLAEEYDQSFDKETG